jgi:DNA-directed RNA polymerase specialized sigma24 family protein
LKEINKIYQGVYATAKNELRKSGCSSQHFDDIFQDVLIILLEKQKTAGLKMRNTQSYITQMCKYLWFKERKRQDNHEMLNESELSGDPEPSTGNELQQLLAKHLKNLSSTCRKVLILYSQGYSENKIGSVLNLGDRNAVKNKKYYCKETLRNLIMNDPEFKEIHG